MNDSVEFSGRCRLFLAAFGTFWMAGFLSSFTFVRGTFGAVSTMVGFDTIDDSIGFETGTDWSSID
jgi:hypothetical protein